MHLNEGDIGGTNFLATLTALKERVFNTPSSKIYTLIFLSDGGDNQWEAATSESKQKIQQEILAALPDPQQFSLQFFAIGLGGLTPKDIPRVSLNGQPVQSALNPILLQAMAKHLNGVYDQANQWTAWSLSSDIIERMGQDPLMTAKDIQMQELQLRALRQGNMLSDLYFQIPLGMAILFYILNLLLPETEHRS